MRSTPARERVNGHDDAIGQFPCPNSDWRMQIRFVRHPRTLTKIRTEIKKRLAAGAKLLSLIHENKKSIPLPSRSAGFNRPFIFFTVRQMFGPVLRIFSGQLHIVNHQQILGVIFLSRFGEIE